MYGTIRLMEKGSTSIKKPAKIASEATTASGNKTSSTTLRPKKSVSEPFIWRTQKEVCEAIGILSSTLNSLIKQSTKLLKITIGKGCSAKTGWTTVALYIEYIIHLKQDLGIRFAEFLRPIVQEHMDLLKPIAGYTTLSDYVQKLLRQQRLTEQLSMSETFVNTG